MPLIKMQTNVSCEKEKKEQLTLKLSKICAECTGKPEAYVASMIEDDWTIAFAGKPADSAFVEVRGIGGLTPAVNKKLSAAICKMLETELGISGERVYINFMDVPATNWGWKGSTFA